LKELLQCSHRHHVDDGTLPIKEKALCIPHAKAKLLSLRELIEGGGSFQGYEKKLVIFNDKSSVVVEGTNSGDGFWTCRLKDVKAFPVTAEDPERETQTRTQAFRTNKKFPTM
jgi:hypothetical protein